MAVLSSLRRAARVPLRILSVLLFFAIAIALIQLVVAIQTPYQRTSTLTDKINSFYKEPSNTIEVLFLGPSTTEDGFVPARLYEEYGICAYNLGSSAQPMLGSYVLAKEAHRRHPDSLKTIVLEVSTLSYESGEGFYRMILDEVPLQSKLKTVLEWETPKEERLVYLSNLYGYHNRLKELGRRDVEKLFYPLHPSLRGYSPLWNRATTEGDKDLWTLPKQAPDLSAEPTYVEGIQQHYLEEIASFCKDEGINLLLCKTPGFHRWSDGQHNAAQALADSLGLTFIDYNYEPFFSQTGYNQALDTREGFHPNDSGAQKITSYLGAYLVENGLASDVRGDDRYAFLEDQLVSYRAFTSDLDALRHKVDVVDYLEEALADPTYTLYVGIDGKGASELTFDQRRRLEALGLTWLSTIQPTQSYRCVIEDGNVVDEELASRADTRLYTCYVPEMNLEPKQDYLRMYKSSAPEAIAALAYDTATSDPARQDEAEWSTWRFVPEGITVMVYDNDQGALVDEAVFRAENHLKRFCDPEALLESYLSAGADDAQIPWYLLQLKLYEERLAKANTAFDAAPK